MTALVIGPNGSGKSACAERMAADMASGPLVYIATMIPHGEDGKRRVERHVKQRRRFNFATIEAPYSVSAHAIPANATVLLEDVSNLLANVMFEHRGGVSDVLTDVFTLSAKCKNLIVVSIGGLTPDDGGDEGTRGYIRALDTVNSTLIDWADKAVSMEGGDPIEITRP